MVEKKALEGGLKNTSLQTLSRWSRRRQVCSFKLQTREKCDKKTAPRVQEKNSLGPRLRPYGKVCRVHCGGKKGKRKNRGEGGW